MKLTEKIKARIIHWLGGWTRKDIGWNYRMGERQALMNVLNATAVHYGEPADKWCKSIYEYVKWYYEHITSLVKETEDV